MYGRSLSSLVFIYSDSINNMLKVTPGDFTETITSLLDPTFLPPPDGMNNEHLRTMVQRWERYVAEGVFTLSVPAATPLGGGSDGTAELAEFWTSPAPYWDMRLHAPKLWNALKRGNLVIFKVKLEISFAYT
jgi:hypothetical protein